MSRAVTVVADALKEELVGRVVDLAIRQIEDKFTNRAFLERFFKFLLGTEPNMNEWTPQCSNELVKSIAKQMMLYLGCLADRWQEAMTDMATLMMTCSVGLIKGLINDLAKVMPGNWKLPTLTPASITPDQLKGLFGEADIAKIVQDLLADKAKASLKEVLHDGTAETIKSIATGLAKISVANVGVAIAGVNAGVVIAAFGYWFSEMDWNKLAVESVQFVENSKSIETGGRPRDYNEDQVISMTKGLLTDSLGTECKITDKPTLTGIRSTLRNDLKNGHIHAELAPCISGAFEKDVCCRAFKRIIPLSEAARAESGILSRPSVLHDALARKGAWRAEYNNGHKKMWSSHEKSLCLQRICYRSPQANLRDIFDSLAQQSDVDVEKFRKSASRLELTTLTPTHSNDIVRLVGIDLEFFKDVEGNKLNFPSQIGLCYYDVDVTSGTIGTRVDVLRNVCIEQPEKDLDQVDWDHANQFIGISNAHDFKSRESTQFSHATTKVIGVCEGFDFYFVGQSIAYDIIGMKFFVGKERIIDIAEVYKPNYNGSRPSLSTLARDKLNMSIQTGIHPPLQDAYIPIEILCKDIGAGAFALPHDSPQADVQTWSARIDESTKGRIIGREGKKIALVRCQYPHCDIKLDDTSIRVVGGPNAGEVKAIKAMLAGLAKKELQWRRCD